MRFKFVWLAAALALAFSGPRPAYASCAAEYLGGAAPRMTIALTYVRELCFDAFAVGHSAASRTPLWSAEHLTAGDVAAARALDRHDSFHSEQQLPTGERAVLADYTRSGYDRGHMAPNGDMPTRAAQAQSFSLANIAPQSPALNRGLWSEVEENVRDMALEDGDVFVVTGPIFDNTSSLLRGRVRVPSSVFKAIYDPHTGVAAAYVADNTPGNRYQVISIAALRQLTGVDVFPTLAESVKRRAGFLPPPGRWQVASSERHPPAALQR